MLQKPPLERVVGNDNNTATPKTAHEKFKNIATKTENTTKVSKEGVSAESSSAAAPEKSQVTCDSNQIKKPQDTTEVTKHLELNHTKNLSSGGEKPGLTFSSNSSENERLVKIYEKWFFPSYRVLHITPFLVKDVSVIISFRSNRN